MISGRQADGSRDCDARRLSSFLSWLGRDVSSKENHWKEAAWSIDPEEGGLFNSIVSATTLRFSPSWGSCCTSLPHKSASSCCQRYSMLTIVQEFTREKVQCLVYQLNWRRWINSGPSASLARPHPSMAGCLEPRVRLQTRKNPGDTALRVRLSVVVCCGRALQQVLVPRRTGMGGTAFGLFLLDWYFTIHAAALSHSSRFVWPPGISEPWQFIGQEVVSVIQTASARRKHQAKIHTCITKNTLHIATASS